MLSAREIQQNSEHGTSTSEVDVSFASSDHQRDVSDAISFTLDVLLSSGAEPWQWQACSTTAGTQLLVSK